MLKKKKCLNAPLNSLRDCRKKTTLSRWRISEIIYSPLMELKVCSNVASPTGSAQPCVCFCTWCLRRTALDFTALSGFWLEGRVAAVAPGYQLLPLVTLHFSNLDTTPTGLTALRGHEEMGHFIYSTYYWWFNIQFKYSWPTKPTHRIYWEYLWRWWNLYK